MWGNRFPDFTFPSRLIEEEDLEEEDSNLECPPHLGFLWPKWILMMILVWTIPPTNYVDSHRNISVKLWLSIYLSPSFTLCT